MGLRAGLLPLRPPRRPSPTLAAPLQLASTSFRSPTPSPHLKTQLDHEQPVEPAQLDQEPDQIGAFLDTACEGDDLLRGKVEALLASHERAGRFIETPAAG